jgi:imidazolonepropionase
MPERVVVVNSSQLVTLKGPPRPRSGAEMLDLGVVTNGALLAEDGWIVAAGPRPEVEPFITKDTKVIDAGGRAILPGFVDAHTHAVFAGNRIRDFEQRIAGSSYEQIAAGGGGIRSTVRQTRGASEEDLYAAGVRFTGWFLRCGTTTVEAKSGYGLTVEDELKILRVIRKLGDDTPVEWVPTFMGAHEIPDEYRDARNEYLFLLTQEMLPRVAEGHLAEFCDAFVEPGLFSADDVRLIAAAARYFGMRMRLHVDQLSNSKGAELAAELRVASADHLEKVSAEGIAALRMARVQPVLLPASVFLLGLAGYAPARAMIEAGLAVVVATDFNPGTAPAPSMLLALSLACTQMKMLPAEALTAATINAAYSLNRGHEIGSLEPGKRADFVIYETRDWRELVYYAGVEHPWMVFTRGRIAMERMFT